jgi:transglutaminase-like putative cysteine protease
MSILSVTHQTTYHYSSPVETAHHLAFVRPVQTSYQQVLDYRLQIDPRPAHVATRIDAFGNEALHFSLHAPHEQLQVTAHSVVQIAPRFAGLDAARSATLQSVRQHLRYSVGEAFLPESEFCFASRQVTLDPAFIEYAAASLSDETTVLTGAIDLMHRIYADFTYEPEATEVSTTALEALRLRHGVCQDYAQVMIGCLRSIGLPARYISGYLLTSPPPGQPRLIGADASHAWVQVYCPVYGWVDLDPTNDVLAGSTHVTLAIGRDYSDVAPLRGVLRGGGAHTLDVSVSVVPQNELAGLDAAQSMTQSQSQSQLLSQSRFQSQSQS